ARKIDASVKPAPEHLFIFTVELCDHFVGHSLLCGQAKQGQIFYFLDAPYGDVFPGGHFIAHEVLKDDANVTIQVLQIVLAQVDKDRRLIGNAREGPEDLLNIRACLMNCPGKECELTDGKQLPLRSPDHEDVGGVVTSGPDNR